MYQIGQLFQPEGRSTLLNGRLIARRMRFAPNEVTIERLAILLARAYVSPHTRTTSPDALVSPYLPVSDKPRKADFGEFLCQLLYCQIFGHEIPFSRLWAKPAPDATQQGADCVSVIVNPAEPATPHSVEVKVRTGRISASQLLGDIAASGSVARDGAYLAGAWRSGLDKLDAHPGARTAYAYSAARHLALLDGSRPEDLPPHIRHALIVTDGADVKSSDIESKWSPIPPVSELTILVTPSLAQVIETVFMRAGELRVGNLRNLAEPSDLAIGSGQQPFAFDGLLSPTDRNDVASWRAAQQNCESHPILEVALWYLADQDGIAQARAKRLDDHEDPFIRTIGLLLSGKDREALAIASMHLHGFVNVIQQCLAMPRTLHADLERIRAAAVTASSHLHLAEHRLALRFTAEAIAYRLLRLPSRLLSNSGQAGPKVMAVSRALYQNGMHALWPSQTKAIEAGLLSQPPSSFVLKLPTSGGKTALIGLVAANALDSRPDSRVVVVAPSRALVNQLRSDLLKLFPGTTTVMALHGEMEIGNELSGDRDDADVITVMTPERFDLDWRRSQTVEELRPLSTVISHVIVDEAHHLAATTRGARLELALSRVLRADIPITLVSSQLGAIDRLAEWISGTSSESTWHPAHHIRQAYFRDGDSGILMADSNEIDARLSIDRRPSSRTPIVADESVRDQAAALATQMAQDGLVVLYSSTKRNIDGLVSCLYARVRNDPPRHLGYLDRLASDLSDAAGEERELLRAGIGVHHRDVRQEFRRTVEQAARDGHLRYLICTSTLMEGVDFPTRTVLMVYPVAPGGSELTIGSLRNLAGRAGRGGHHTSGRIVVFSKDKKAAERHLRLFRQALPPTRSQLDAAVTALRTCAEGMKMDPIDHFLLAALAESALNNTDLRHEIESIIGRSLFFASIQGVRRDNLLDAAEQRAQAIASVRSSPWLHVVYRTGLSLRTCELIRDKLSQMDLTEIITRASDWQPTPSDVLGDLVAGAIVGVPELKLSSVLSLTADTIVRDWLAGSDASITAGPNSASIRSVRKAFESLGQSGPWLVGATIEIIGHLAHLSYRDRVTLHANLQIERLRTGTNSLEASKLVHEGMERTDASVLWTEYLAQASTNETLFRDFVRDCQRDR